MPRFPFPLGSPVPPPAVIPPPPPFWTGVGPNSLHWQAVHAGQIPRFEHIFPQESGAQQQWKRDTEPPFGTP